MSLKYGADQCDVILSEGESLSISAQLGKVDKYKISGSSVLGLRVIKDGHIGLSYSEAQDKESIQLMCKKALEKLGAKKQKCPKGMIGKSLVLDHNWQNKN